MSYKINVLDPSLSVVGELENIKSAEIYEVINNQYVADVEIAENTFPSFLHFPNMLEIDDDYFIIADIDKQRSNSKSINLSLEHVSYLLNDPSGAIPTSDDQEEEYLGTIQDIISNLWGGIEKFTVTTDIVGEFLYLPKTTGGRSRIQEFARQNGLEVTYNKFNITINQRRGNNKGLEFRVGKNVKSVTQKITLNDDFYVEYAHEVDIIDFSKLPKKQKEDIASAEIGDTVRIVDTDLAIDATERIVAKRYSPLFKEVPKISVGQVIRDIVDIINEKEEEKEEEDDPRANFLLESFKIGTIECLDLSNVEVDNDNVLPSGISTNVDFNEYEKLKGAHIRLKPHYSSYHVTVYKVLQNDDFEIFNYATSSTDINNWALPTEEITGIGVLVTAVPFAEFDANIHKFAQYGIKFNRSPLDVFREVRVGKVNTLNLEGVTLFPPLDLPTDITAEVPFEEGTTLTGLFVSMKQNYKNWHVKVTTYNEAGTPTDYNLADIEATAKTWTMPSPSISAIALTAMEKPPKEFVDGTHKKQTIAFSFLSTMEDEKSYLSEFKIGEEDCLTLPGIIIEKADLELITAELKYTKDDEFTGLFLKLEEKYREATIVVTDETGKTINYSDTIVLPNGIKKILVTVTYADKKQYYGLQFVQVEFVGLITIKSKDEDGNIIATREQSYTEIGVYEITADEIEGYLLVSDSPIKVELTLEEREKTVEFIYQDIGGGNSANTGYTMEFGTAVISSNITFSLTREYDAIEAVTFGLMGSPTYVNFAWSPIINNAGKSVGITVMASPVVTGKSVSVQAVCYKP